MIGVPGRGVVAASLATLTAFSILIALGVWQLERRAWKLSLLARIAAAENAPPVALSDSGVPSLFTRVRVQGTLRPMAALYGADVRGEGAHARMGAQLVQVLDRQAGPPVLVDLGWVPVERGAEVRPREGPVSLVGFVRPAEQAGWLSAPDDRAGRHFYTLDPKAIGASLGTAGVAPLTLVALGAGQIGGPVPAERLPQPPNNHLQYALTWFGLAAALAVVSGVAAIRGKTNVIS